MREKLIEYLLDNQLYFKDKYQTLFSKRDDLKASIATVFHSDIDSDLKNLLVQDMSIELSRATGADIETIMIVLEDMNMGEFFK